jgi:hypothetical protein
MTKAQRKAKFLEMINKKKGKPRVSSAKGGKGSAFLEQQGKTKKIK